MPEYETVIQALEARDCSPRGYGEKVRAKCPVHGSRGGTLLVNNLGGKGIVHCFAGCEWQDVLKELSLDVVEGVSWTPRPRPVDGLPKYRSPIRSAKEFGCKIKHVGDGMWVGRCVCGGRVTAGSDGADCENGCDVQGVGEVVGDLRDAQVIHFNSERTVMAVKTLEILGCTEIKRGTSAKTGREWVLYKVHANDESGQAISEELTAFNDLPRGRGEYEVEKRESAYGTSFTVKNPSPLQKTVTELSEQVTSIIARLDRLEAGDKARAPEPAGDFPF